jgi:hypothetical protein
MKTIASSNRLELNRGIVKGATRAAGFLGNAMLDKSS